MMKTTQDYITTLQNNANELRQEYGVQSLRIYGSVARGEQTEDSDVDICVDMPPRLFSMAGLNRFLESLLQAPVDIVRLHKHINPFLLKQINRDGIVVF